MAHVDATALQPLERALRWTCATPGSFSTWEVPPVSIWGFPKIRVTILRVSIIRIIVYWGLYWGLYWGPPILGNYHISLRV